jgi:peptide-methionine (S)-S-oxide reductase
MTQDTAIFAAGCFWCVEAVFDMLQGVELVEPGYIGGHVPNPTYKRICDGDTGHAEAIRIHFDPARVSYDDLLELFFHVHDPTQLNRQGNDVGTQYRSAIFPLSPEQAEAARAAIAKAEADWPRPIVTTIEDGAQPFTVAEDYHHDYFERVGTSNPYCAGVVAPKVRKFREKYAGRLKR